MIERQHRNFGSLIGAALLATSLLLSACASAPANGDVYDPYEKVNRGVYEFNTFLDKGLIRPVAKGYRYVTPYGIRSRIGNFSDNLREPVNMLNAFLQGDFTQGMVDFWRFLLNTTVGLGGLNDVASTAGLKHRTEDFGQTLAAWGSGPGPFIELPLLGPSNGRDTVGRVVDFATTPWYYFMGGTGDVALTAGQGLVERERLIDPMDDIYDTSLDPYITFRSVYDQHRNAAIRNTQDSTSYLGALDKNGKKD
jgi:phospholipid-binding lipoprotein MlaA